MQMLSGTLPILWAVAGSGSLIRRKADNAPVVDAMKWGVSDLIDQMNGDLMKMNSRLGSLRSFLQVGVVDSPASSKGSSSRSAPVDAIKPATKAGSRKSFDPQAVVMQMDSLNQMGSAQLPAMLGLLTEMYSGWKEKIGVANKREKEEKTEFDTTIRDLELKKKRSKTGDAKFDANSTKTYDKIEKYWRLQRKIAHRQYHTVLKLAHAGMAKFKTVMNAMHGAIDSKKPDRATLKKIQSMEEPEVVLLQMVESLTHWAHHTISLLRDAKNPSSAKS
eukprot:gnl/MRDRNA2_/MRDRNA2_104238_c0_seq1.p1 gnl/MRDRNA2_/MRDRNA2_104238_c0~~gnl/MRDRNA2_/MRDRNA2_104238_c0_seq1.p1  ORF type:complete len:276 (-),score=61.46 gnl/MRDRNA2_/MRDRNA2_104238_c0_seq1:74-901(-)